MPWEPPTNSPDARPPTLDKETMPGTLSGVVSPVAQCSVSDVRITIPIDQPAQLLSSLQSAPLPPSLATEPPLPLSSVPGTSPVARSPATRSIPQSMRLHEKNMCARTEGDQWRRHLSRSAKDVVITPCFLDNEFHADKIRNLRTWLPREKS